MDVYSYDEMSALKEDQFRIRVLLPLLKAMGYNHVRDWHGGSAEQGKDLLCWWTDSLGHRRNLAIVAKAVNRGHNSQKQDAVAQVTQTFTIPFFDKTTGDEQVVHGCWIVTNKTLAVGGTTLLRGTVGEVFSRNVSILDGPQVWERVGQHFPVEINEAVMQLSSGIENPQYSTQLSIGEVKQPIAIFSVGDKSVTIGEKVPGQLESEPFRIQTALSFPDSKEGRAKTAEVRRALEGNGSVIIPGEYIGDISFPEAALKHVSSILGAVPTEWSSIQISPNVPLRRFLASIELYTDDEMAASIPYIDFVERSRTEDEVVFSNENQPMPISAILRINHACQQITWTVSLANSKISAPLYRDFLRFVSTLDHPCEVVITPLEIGLPLGRTVNVGHAEPSVDPGTLNWATALAQVQEECKVPIFIPDREFTPDEIETIEFLWALVENPCQTGTWKNGSGEFGWDSTMATEMLDAFTDQPEFTLRKEETVVADLFGSVIPLGRVETVYETVALADKSLFRSQVQELGLNESVVSVAFLPGTSPRVTIRYLDWEATQIDDELL